MSVLANTAFLNRIKSMYPRKLPAVDNPWYIVAAVAFCGSNRAEEVPRVFQHTLKEVKEEGGDQAMQLLLARKFREALFKAGLTAGYPRTINSLISLHEIMPEELRDTRTMRHTKTSISQHEKTGEAMFRNIYGETAHSVQGLLNAVYPDLGWFSNAIGYGLTYGFTDIISPIETSFAMVAALIVSDSPRQIQWHLDGARRRGVSFQEAQAIRAMTMEVAIACGMKWRNDVPEVKEFVV